MQIVRLVQQIEEVGGKEGDWLEGS